MEAASDNVTLEQAISAVDSVLAESRSGGQTATADATWEELGFTSLDIAAVFTALEELNGGELPTERANEIEGVGDLVRLRWI